MKKRRLRKGFKIIIIFFIFIVLFFVIKNVFKDTNDYKNDDIDYVSSVYNKLDGFDKDFLNWINDNYEGSIKKLDELLEDGYDISYWHEVTGYSYIVLNDLYNKTYDTMNNIVYRAIIE